MTNEPKSKAFGLIRETTAWREWLGWFGSIMWFFCMINWYEYLMKYYSEANVYGFSLAFKLVFLLSIIGFGYKYSRDPDGLGELAHYTTPIAFLLTIGFSFVPVPFGSALYAISPLFFAPALVRRVYGITRIAKPGYTFTLYMLAIGVAFVPMNAFLDYYYYTDVPLTIAYASIAVFALIAWIGIRRKIGIPDDTPGLSGFRVTKSTVCFFIAVFLVACWLFKMKSIVDYTMEQFDDFLYIPVYIILPGVYYALFGYISDKKRERPVFIGVFVAYLILLQLVFLLGDPTSTQNKVVIPLVILNHLAGNIIEYFLYIIPVYFLAYSNHPVFIAPLGVASYLAMRTVRWALEPFFPEATHISNLTSLFPGIPQLNDLPLFVSTAISAIAFFIIINMIYERYREKTLAAAFYAFLHRGAGGRVSLTETRPADTAEDTDEAVETQTMINAGFTQEEMEVALLMLDGLTARDIGRKLHVSATIISQHGKSIRQKLNYPGDSDSVIAAVTEEYKLTNRETDVLKYLRDGLTTEKTANELYITAETVRSHVSSLLKKVGLEKRSDVSTWLEGRRKNPK